jgi:UDP-glucuronate decarboxylase
MRYLVTGAAGFLGSHLCDRLIKENHEVLAVDNFYTGSRRNIQHLIRNPNFEMLRHDITLPLYVEVDGIFNLACPASPIHYQRFPVQTIKTSILGSINMLGLAKRLNIPILQASTSEIYGDPEISPQPENYWGNVNPIGLRSCYDEGKRAAETLFVDYQRQYGVDIKLVRIFNTYGPNMSFDDGRVVSNFILQALRNEPVTVFGEGKQTRSFCYVTDLIDGLMRMMEINDSGPINLGNSRELSILEVVQIVLKETGSNSEIVFRELPSDDPKQRKPDLTKAKEILNWEAKVGFEEGVRLTVTDFKKRLG